MSMSISTRIHFAIKTTPSDSTEELRDALSAKGIHINHLDVESQELIVTTNLPSQQVQDVIEQTGRHVVIKGIGPMETQETKNAAVPAEAVAVVAAVAELGAAHASGAGPALGVVRFLQRPRSGEVAGGATCVVDGTVDNLAPDTPHHLSVRRYGDISHGCNSCGDCYRTDSDPEGQPTGDLGTVNADHMGRAAFKFDSDKLKVADIIGRSIVICEQIKDNPPSSDQDKSQVGQRSAASCGIIARSAGLFDNPKTICACSGKTLWDERDQPVRSKLQGNSC